MKSAEGSLLILQLRTDQQVCGRSTGQAAGREDGCKVYEGKDKVKPTNRSWSPQKWQKSLSVLAASDLDGMDALQKPRPFIPAPNTHPGAGEASGGSEGGWNSCRPDTCLMLTR